MHLSCRFLSLSIRHGKSHFGLRCFKLPLGSSLQALGA